MWGNFVSQKAGCNDFDEKTLRGRAMCKGRAGRARFGAGDFQQFEFSDFVACLGLGLRFCHSHWVESFAKCLLGQYPLFEAKLSDCLSGAKGLFR